MSIVYNKELYCVILILNLAGTCLLSCTKGVCCSLWLFQTTGASHGFQFGLFFWNHVLSCQSSSYCNKLFIKEDIKSQLIQTSMQGCVYTRVWHSGTTWLHWWEWVGFDQWWEESGRASWPLLEFLSLDRGAIHVLLNSVKISDFQITEEFENV